MSNLGCPTMWSMMTMPIKFRTSRGSSEPSPTWWSSCGPWGHSFREHVRFSGTKYPSPGYGDADPFGVPQQAEDECELRCLVDDELVATGHQRAEVAISAARQRRHLPSNFLTAILAAVGRVEVLLCSCTITTAVYAARRNKEPDAELVSCISRTEASPTTKLRTDNIGDERWECWHVRRP